jgi:hypothetical protein
MVRRVQAGVVAVLVGCLLAAPSVAAAGDHASRPGAYYLSLGDSLGFGAQFDRIFAMLDAGTYTPDAFDTGYTDVFAVRLRSLRPGLQVLNLSCPGESAVTMVAGGCFFTTPPPDGFGLAIHVDYDGPQLAAALGVLRAHRGQVDPISISIGAADAGDVIVNRCAFDPACVDASGLRRQLARDVGRILLALRLAAPTSKILVFTAYNQFLIDDPRSAELWRTSYTDVERAVSALFGARVVDGTKVISTTAELCALTFVCATGDGHPTDEGYRRIGNLMYDVWR